MKIPESPPFFDIRKYADAYQALNSKGKFLEAGDLTDLKYYYWDKCKYIAQEWDIEPGLLWTEVKAKRLSNKKYHLGNTFRFGVGSPSIVQRFLHEFDMNLGGSLQGDGIIPSEDRDRYLISSLMEEAIASSQLEGADTARVVAKRMLETRRPPRNISEQMILNNYMAMQWIVENKQQSFNPENIKHLHAILTRETYINKNEVGQFRQDDDVKVVDSQTGKVLHHPPSHAALQEIMNAFCDFANSEQKDYFLHPITKGVILHFLIGYIHPFADGNGRTARTIFYWYLLKHGYWLIEYMSVSKAILNSKAQYARAYLHSELDENDLTYFLIYNLKSIHIALKDLKAYIKRKVAEKKNMIIMLKDTHFNDRQIGIIQEILKDSTTYFTVQQIQTTFNVSNQTARNDLMGLVSEGIIELGKKNKTARFFPAKDYINKLKVKNKTPQ